jgi:hypothetical protein
MRNAPEWFLILDACQRHPGPGFLLLYQPKQADGGGDSSEEADGQGFGEVFLFERGTQKAAFEL